MNWWYCLLITLAQLGVLCEGMFVNCSYPKQQFNPELEVQRFGKPTPFVATKSTRVSPYSLIDPYRQSTVYHEYLLIGPGMRLVNRQYINAEEIDELENEGEEHIQLVIYDEEALHAWEFHPNLVQQNLVKEYLWGMVNATGMLPSLTVVNTTYERTFRFHTDEGNEVSYSLEYPRSLRSQETMPPLDMVVEFPAKTRMFQSLKTMIDFQTVGLLRWRLTPREPNPWGTVSGVYEWPVAVNDPKICSRPSDDIFTNPEYLRCIYAKRFKFLVVPCIKDMIFVYEFYGVIGGIPPFYNELNDTYKAKNGIKIFLPMVDDVLDYGGVLYLTEAFCPDPELYEECGSALDLVLTNDHLLILTDKGIWVSSSLNTSTTNVSMPYSMKPLLKFTPIDPCAQFDNFNCSEVDAPVMAKQTIKRQRLFYTPVCHRFQTGQYDDMVIFALEHVTQDASMSRERDAVSILYSSKPYNDWKILIHNQTQYSTRNETLEISELIGVFYNAHRRQFDLTLLLWSHFGAKRRIRFVLPHPPDSGDSFTGYTDLNGLLGNGFLDFEFPHSFEIKNVEVNPEPLDVFFLGNQIWIAEAGGPFPYMFLPFVSDEQSIASEAQYCSFNHPDRTFVCVEKTHTTIYPGRVGVSYTTTKISFSVADDFRYTMFHNMWPYSFRIYVTLLGRIIVSYSGKINLWYLFSNRDLVATQQSLIAEMNGTGRTCLDYPDLEHQPIKCHVCQRLTSRVWEHGCSLVPNTKAHPNYRMLSVVPFQLRPENPITEGPLVPFLFDGDKVLLFEAIVPQLENYKLEPDYTLKVDKGSTIYCRTPVDTPPPSPPPAPPTPPVGRRRREDPGFNLPEEEGLDGLRRTSRQGTAPTAPYNVTCPSTTVNLWDKHTCELYIRHIKTLERNQGEQAFLKGFRQVLYATIVHPFQFRPVPVDIVVLVLPNSNQVLLQLDKSMFEQNKEWLFEYTDVGQTLFIPDHFSILLEGFPKFICTNPTSKLTHDRSRMKGIATKNFRQGARIVIRPYRAYLIDFSTPAYCKWYRTSLKALEPHFTATTCTENPVPSDYISQQYRERRNALNEKRIQEHERRNRLSESISFYYENTFVGGSGTPVPTGWSHYPLDNLDPLDPPTYQQMEDNALFIPLGEAAVGGFQGSKFERNITQNSSEPEYFLKNMSCRTSAWKIVVAGCHLRLYLDKNSVIKQNGGRISLDRYDSISLQLKLRPLTALGQSLMTSPLISVTNTNPDVLHIDSTEPVGTNIQVMNITLSPTGFRTGISAVTIRPSIVSNACRFSDGSFTLVVLMRKDRGRRLHVNYPVPICKPKSVHNPNDDEDLLRPWKIDLPGCVTREELLQKSQIYRPEDSEVGILFYSELPVNYRPPSSRGVDIPLSHYVYNVDPLKPRYKAKYKISRETARLTRCKVNKPRKFCACTKNNELSDDVLYTECKRMVYTAKRGFRVDLSVEYDRVMRDEDQHMVFFTRKTNWTVYLEEVNERTEYTISSQTNPYLDYINSDVKMNQGRKMYDAKTLGVTMHGTGLFHFKVTLGHYESFSEVSGYFMIFIPDDQLNHVQLVVIMLLTMTVCMAFVFIGFLLVRRRLSSQLPFQTHHHNEKFKIE